MANLWVGQEKANPKKFWVYDKSLDEDDPVVVTLFRVDRHESGFSRTYSDELGEHVTVSREIFRQTLRTADPEVRRRCIKTYEWFKELVLEQEREHLHPPGGHWDGYDWIYT